MNQVKQIQGLGITVVGDDIDTDRIIPARFLRCVTFDGLGEQVFKDDRAATNGQHPFDLPQYQDAKILVVNKNFGCGSSREHAPQAIARWGIRAIVGESFAEIFFGNCVAIGVPCVIAEADKIQQLQTQIQQAPQTPMSVNLETLEVSCGDLSVSVQMNEGSRQMFLQGTWDNCGQLISTSEQIKATASKLPYINWQSA
jgi:3-isopropylmalate/(R)-2-methylmalate dehydratase small subunit